MHRLYVIFLVAVFCQCTGCNSTSELEDGVVGVYTVVRLYDSGSLLYEDIPFEIIKSAEGLVLDIGFPAMQGPQPLTKQSDTLSFYDLHFEYPCDDYVKGSLYLRNDSLLISITDKVCGAGQNPSRTQQLEGYAKK